MISSCLFIGELTLKNSIFLRVLRDRAKLRCLAYTIRTSSWVAHGFCPHTASFTGTARLLQSYYAVYMCTYIYIWEKYCAFHFVDNIILHSIFFGEPDDSVLCWTNVRTTYIRVVYFGILEITKSNTKINKYGNTWCVYQSLQSMMTILVLLSHVVW